MSRFFLHLLVLLAFLPLAARAQEAPPHADIVLHAETTDIKPGERIMLGFEQILDPGWHTYWKNPGDSGQAMAVHWSLPEGFTAGDLQWPLPHRIPFGPLMNYGYEGRALILQEITAPQDLPEGPIELKADIEILVCAEICIPEEKSVSVMLNAGGAGNPEMIARAKGALPRPASLDATYAEEGGNLVLRFAGAAGAFTAADAEKIEFFPLDWGIVVNAAPQSASLEGDTLTLTQKRDTRPLSAISSLGGVLVLTKEDGQRIGYEITAAPQQIAADQSGLVENTSGKAAAEETTFAGAILLALLGGMILNLMPCVFPVLSIKALSLVKLSEKHPAHAAIHGLAYTAGILLCFALVAGVLIALKAAGAQIGWGFQLQNPAVVLALAYLVFIIGLNLSGVFEFGGSFGNLGGRLAAKDGPAGSFFTGILATLVATPCTAPFMGAAMGYALVQPAPAAMAVFLALGLGLALPFLILSLAPPLRRIMPRSGAWMETFRQFLAFPMYATAVWLVWVLAQQSGSSGILLALSGMLAIAFGVWIVRAAPAQGARRLAVLLIAALAFLIAAAPLALVRTTQSHEAALPTAGAQPYSAVRLEEALQGPDPVFVEMTAAWCITCKVNERVALTVPSTQALFAEKRVLYLVGDWTNYDPAITEYLSRFGRNGVPIYVYYGVPDKPGGQRPEPVLLPQLLTPAIVADYIQ